MYHVLYYTDLVLGSRGPLLISLSRRLKAFLPSLPVLAPIDQTNANKNVPYSSSKNISKLHTTSGVFVYLYPSFLLIFTQVELLKLLLISELVHLTLMNVHERVHKVGIGRGGQLL